MLSHRSLLLNSICAFAMKLSLHFAQTDLNTKYSFLADGLPAPTNVQLRRLSSTALEVSWDPPPVSGIAGYRIHYNMFAIPDIDKWLSVEIGPYSVAELSGLETHTSYVVRVRARGVDGRYGNFSETVVANNLENGIISVEQFKY